TDGPTPGGNLTPAKPVPGGAADTYAVTSGPATISRSPHHIRSMHPSGRIRWAWPVGSGVRCHTTAPGSREARSRYIPQNATPTRLSGLGVDRRGPRRPRDEAERVAGRVGVHVGP